MGRRAVILLCACGAPAPAPVKNHETGVAQLRLADLPNLPATKCNLTALLRDKFPSWTGSSCGMFDTNATSAQLLEAARCIEAARRASRPFVEIHVQDNPQVIVVGQAWLSTGKEIYRADLMADPCGGTCPQNGGVSILHCEKSVAYCNTSPHCYSCDTQTPIARCSN
jgi:hypothetical protein